VTIYFAFEAEADFAAIVGYLERNLLRRRSWPIGSSKRSIDSLRTSSTVQSESSSRV
jgi:hypothetical protein